MNKSRLLSAVCAVLFTLITVSANAALVGVLPATPGGSDWQAVYDDDRDISWAANANLAAGNIFGLAAGVSLGTHPDDTSGIDGIINPNGTMNWPGALFWIDAMNNANYLGFNDWRLPTTSQPDASCGTQFDPGGGFPLQGFGFGCTGSEMGHLSNDEGVHFYPPPALFPSVQFSSYWSANAYAPDPLSSWYYSFLFNRQDIVNKGESYNVWAVHSGNVGPVPIPAAVWLFSYGLLGLIGLARKKAA